MGEINMDQTNKPILSDISLHNLLSPKSKKILEDEGLTFVGAYWSETKDKDKDVDVEMNQRAERNNSNNIALKYLSKTLAFLQGWAAYDEIVQEFLQENPEDCKKLQDLKKGVDMLLDSLQEHTGEPKEEIKNLQSLKKILDKLHV